MINLRDIIRTTLRNHPADCLFAEDAENKIFEQCEPFINQEPELLIDTIVCAIKSQEIYCPHEGIDRREEYAQGRWQG